MRGAFARARDYVRQARAIQSDLGQSLSAEISCAEPESELELAVGNPAAAQRVLEASLAVLRRMGEHSYGETREVQLAGVLYVRGRFEEAAEHVENVRAGSSSEDVTTEWRWRAVAAKLAAQEGDFDQADELSQAAVHVLEGTDNLNARAECLLDRAEVLSLAGREQEAGSAVDAAVSLFELKENEVGAARARALLSETTESP